MGKHFFLAGIIQGSYSDEAVFDQGYRQRIKTVLETRYPDASVYCPVEHHPDSVGYSDEKARAVFFHHLDLVRKSDAVIVFLPEASMGSAIEMWAAHEQHVPVISITTMKTNWVVRLLSDATCLSIEDFEDLVEKGQFDSLLESE